ncbi:aminotransferase class I/II-fold pyridoxal phosphate-dependent enzyme [Undibacterium danionis]|uniref:histidinol-phosphate transaminase n=1 Tax=Undibacterium danionis TaxID=1812100 RepID=A0ABV6II25_9BURK
MSVDVVSIKCTDVNSEIQSGIQSRIGLRVHGGTDALGKPAYDFSTNSNALGPCPEVVERLRATDCSSYPDPDYHDLRAALAQWHGVDPERIVFAASASEFIFRITQTVAANSLGRTRAWWPEHSYTDYAMAARAHSVVQTSTPVQAHLIWACDPASPLGCGQENLSSLLNQLQARQTMILDCAYQPLRLQADVSLSAQQRDQIWQLWSPNKALGLTGIRGAYAIAPKGAETLVSTLRQSAFSWPLGAHAVTMLEAWTTPQVQTWLAQSLLSLSVWKERQIDLCKKLNWTVLPSVANFYCATPPLSSRFDSEELLRTLRFSGIKLRDTTSFGLPGSFRLRVMSPEAQDALYFALSRLNL